jgi:hypothetical protein
VRRGLAAMQQGARRHRRLTLASSALDHARASRQPERFPDGTAGLTDEATGSAQPLQVA